MPASAEAYTQKEPGPYTYVIGDIHGCYTELLQLEQQIYKHAANKRKEPFFVSVGDLIDRGPDSLQVVRHFMKGAQAGTHAAVAGNHEASFMEVYYACRYSPAYGPKEHPHFPRYATPLAERFGTFAPRENYALEQFVEEHKFSWLSQGGHDTLSSLGADADDVDTWNTQAAEFAYLESLPILWQNSRSVVTHALADAATLAYARRLLSARRITDLALHYRVLSTIVWNRNIPPAPPDPERTHVSGHTPLQRPEYFPESRILMLDTGCVYGNMLTAWCVDTNEFISVSSGMPRR